jgi:hypothetical protein
MKRSPAQAHYQWNVNMGSRIRESPGGFMAITWPWAIVLCKYSDLPTEIDPPQFYKDLFTKPGASGLCDYWKAVTSGNIDISGSSVFGWLTMAHASAEARALQYPAGRATLFQWGIDAASAAGISLTQFKAVLVLQNFGLDHGAVSTGKVVIVRQDPTLLEFGFMSHEMGHGFGLPHSWSANPDFQYGDGWDVMSWQTSTFAFQYTFQSASGLATVGLNARNLDALGAVPQGATWQPPHPDFSETVTLSPLNQPPGTSPTLIARIGPTATLPVRASQSTFTAEFHQNAGWDRAIPQDTVTIHEIRTDTLSYLQPTRGSSFAVGQSFTTPAPQISIRVAAIDTVNNTATLQIWDLPEGCLRREVSSAPVYLVQNGTKRWVTSPGALFAMGKSWADVRVVPDGALNTLPSGQNIGLTVSVTPGQSALGHPIAVTVHANVLGNPVAGVVKIDGIPVGNTNTSFNYTFVRTKKIVGFGRNRETEWVYPTGEVDAPNFPAASITFPFPLLP